jgi:cardiolipin synthase
MIAEAPAADYRWLSAGQEIFPAMLAAIESAQRSVCLEIYHYSAGSLGERFREALVRARRRGVRVRVLIDALGSIGLAGAFWQPLRAVSGEVREFNPLALNRLGIRNHRKLLVCDERVAFVGGFNIACEYDGDGVTRGWRDLGLKVEGPLAAQLSATFEEMFERADFRHRRFPRLARSAVRRAGNRNPETDSTANEPGSTQILTGENRESGEEGKSSTGSAAANAQLLLSGPGRGRSPIKRALRGDLARARSVRIMAAYFLPTWRIRRALERAVRGGGQVQLILAGKSDVAVSQLAGRSLYRRFLKSGVEIYEYQPQILHAKLIIVDDLVYVGSANLDQRSLRINYELMIRFDHKRMAEEGRALFASHLAHCRRISLEDWRKSRTIWQQLKQYWAYFLLVRVDPYIARRQWRGLPD